LTALALFTGLVSTAPAESWTSSATGQNIFLQLHEPTATNSAAVPLILYLENLAAPRVGTDSDEAIIRDFTAAGYLVAVLDYAHHPQARVPYLNRELWQLRQALREHQLLGDRNLDEAHIFVVPAGDRLCREVVYYRDPVRTLGLDVIYPAHPKHSVGTILEFSCDNVARFGNASLAICHDDLLDGEATEGFAVCMADHPVKAPYKGLDAMPECAWKIKAAVRTLRATGTALELDGRIVPAGFSRGSGMALMLVTTMGMKQFEGHGEYPEVSSDVQGGVILSGRFTYLDLLPKDHMIPRYNQVWGDRTNHLATWREAGALDYLDHATFPLFLSINCTEGDDAQHQMTVLRQRLTALGTTVIYRPDPEPHGHAVPLTPEVAGAMNDYFKSRLN
jgi:hypothetical protein